MSGITHAKVSTKVDSADTSLVRPSDWNAAHTVTSIESTPPPSYLSTTKGFEFDQTGRVTIVTEAADIPNAGSEIEWNTVTVDTTDVDRGANALNVNLFTTYAGGSSSKGARTSVYAYLEHDTPSNVSNTNRNYVALQGHVGGNGDGGGAGTEKGAYFGLSSLASISGAATHVNHLAGAEFNVAALAGSSLLRKTGLVLNPLANDAVQGSLVDAPLVIAGNEAIFWKNGIAFGSEGWGWPFNASSIALDFKPYTGSPNFTVGTVISLTGVTVSNHLINSDFFTIDGSGFVQIEASADRNINFHIPTGDKNNWIGCNPALENYLWADWDTQWNVYTNNVSRLLIGHGIQIGAPSGGDKGPGTANAASGYYLGGVYWSSGAGSPEGVITAPVGSLYSRTNGGALTSLYVKETGVGNTGWVGK